MKTEKVILQPTIEFFLEREKETTLKDLIMIDNATYQ